MSQPLIRPSATFSPEGEKGHYRTRSGSLNGNVPGVRESFVSRREKYFRSRNLSSRRMTGLRNMNSVERLHRLVFVPTRCLIIGMVSTNGMLS